MGVCTNLISMSNLHEYFSIFMDILPLFIEHLDASPLVVSSSTKRHHQGLGRIKGKSFSTRAASANYFQKADRQIHLIVVTTDPYVGNGWEMDIFNKVMDIKRMCHKNDRRASSILH